MSVFGFHSKLCLTGRHLSGSIKFLSRSLTTSAIRPLHLKRTAQSYRQKMVCPATVISVTQETPCIKRLVLQPADSDFTFRPGQWVDVFIPGVDVVGGFSLCSSPKQLTSSGTFELAVKASPHPPARWMSETAKSGDVIDVRVGGDFFFPPVCSHGQPTSSSSVSTESDARGHSAVHNSSQGDYDILLIGGGVGINPLYSILMDVVRHPGLVQDQNSAVGTAAPACEGGLQARCDGPRVQAVTLLHSAQKQEDVLFRDSLESMARPNSGEQKCQVHLCLTRDSVPTDSTGIKHHGGRLSQQLLASSVEELRRSNLLCYVCGPPTMIEWTVEQLQQLKLGDEQILYEKWW
eukprot:scpid55127/ scgid8122/ Oxidoreductase NAD-binding domain-containing protein 1